MKQLSPQELITLKAEHENWVRIYNDSHRLIQTTLNFDTLKGRIETIRKFMLWTFDMRDKGYPIKVNSTKEDALASLDKVFNHHIHRIAMNIANTAEAPKQCEKAIKSLYNLSESLADAPNKETITEEIEVEIIILKSKI